MGEQAGRHAGRKPDKEAEGYADKENMAGMHTSWEKGRQTNIQGEKVVDFKLQFQNLILLVNT